MMRTKKLIAAMIAVIAIAACGNAEEGPSTTADSVVSEVAVAQFRFDPEVTNVTVGATVKWSNSDRILHTVTAGTPDSPGDMFDMELDDAGSTAEFTFDETGEFDYFCAIHPHMTGTVIVTDGS